jgi:hypothetical protein
MVTKLSELQIRDPEKSHPGSKGKKTPKSRIRTTASDPLEYGAPREVRSTSTRLRIKYRCGSRIAKKICIWI